MIRNLKKGIISVYIIFLLVTIGFAGLLMNPGMVDVSADRYTFSFAGGYGTKSDPYQIANVDQLQNMNLYLDDHYILVNDIDASATASWNDGKGFEPVGRDTDSDSRDFQGTKFTGSLDGQGYNITGLFIDRPSEDYIGLFGCIYFNSKIENVCIVDVYMHGQSFIGGLVGEMDNGKVSNCHATGKVIGDGWGVGGLVGNYIFDSTVSNCYAKGDVSGIGRVGGLLGGNNIVESDKPIVRNSFYCIDYTTVNGKNYVTPYGIYKKQFDDWLNNNKSIDIDDHLSKISGTDRYKINCISDLKSMIPFSTYEEYNYSQRSDLDLSSEAGFYVPILKGEFDGGGKSISNLNVKYYNNDCVGMFGKSYTAIRNLSLIDNIVSGSSCIGGLIGNNYGTVENCYATGDVSGTGWHVGGLVGKGGTLKNCYATGTVRGDVRVGGLVGYCGKVSNCYAIGNVNGVDWIGGFVGLNEGTVENCYSAGRVTGRMSGGFCGYNDGTISDCFFDKQTSGMFKTDGGVGQDSLGMKTKSTFTGAGWDFVNTWRILNNCSYPFLQNFIYSLSIGDIASFNIDEINEDIIYRKDYDVDFFESNLPGVVDAPWRLDTDASFLSIDETGVLSGIPQNDDVGTYYVNIFIEILEMDISKYTKFTLTVSNTNDPPWPVEIIKPVDSIEIDYGETLDFQGTCDDPDMPYDPRESLASKWYSNITGEIGTGELLNDILLPIGEHLITFEVTDLAGRNTTVSINVTVLETPQSDTDGDGMPNVWERKHELDPNDPNDVDKDPDNDNLTNIEEYNEGTDPQKPDTDNDGLSDGDEVNTYQTNGTNPDTDDDGHIDGEDAYPLDSAQWEKKTDSAEDNNSVILMGVLIIVIILIIIFALLFKKRQKKAQREKPGVLTDKIKADIPQQPPTPQTPTFPNSHIPQPTPQTSHFTPDQAPTHPISTSQTSHQTQLQIPPLTTSCPLCTNQIPEYSNPCPFCSGELEWGDSS